MENWQPIVKDVNERDLVLIADYGHGIASKTYIHSSEGDTLFIRQECGKNGNIRHMTIDRHELYNLIFNFMSGTELLKLTEKKLELEFKNKS